MARIEEAVGRSAPFIKVQPPALIAQRAPATSDTDYPKGQVWLDESASPSALYTHIGGGVWDQGGNAIATNTVYGLVRIDTDGTLASADDTHVPTTLAAKTYIDSVAIAGAPAWSETVSGIGQLSTSAEATTGTNDDTAMTPLKVAAVLAAPPAIGSGTPAAGSFTTLAASGLSSLSGSATILTAGTALNLASDASADAVNIGTGAAARVITIGNVTGATQVVLNSGTAGIALASTGAGDITIDSDDTVLIDADGVLELNSSGGVIGIGNDANAQNINIGTGAAARTITVGNGTGATSVVVDCGTGALDLGTNAVAHTVTIGNKTGASAMVLDVGTGNFALDGVAGSTYTIGASTTIGTVTIGGTSQTGTFTLGGSDGAMTMNIANADGKKTINIGDGVDGNDIDIGNGINTSAQTIDIANAASAANSTVNILSGNGSAGTQTCNVLGGTRAGALNLATGAAAHVITVGSASAGAVTIDTAANISLDSATASNFTVTGAADLTLASSAGSVIINGEEAAADAIQLTSAAGGLSASVALQMSLVSTQAAGNAIVIDASDAAGGIDMDCGSGGFALDATAGAISIDAALASNFTVTGAADLTLSSSAGAVNITSGESAVDSIKVESTAGGIDILASGAAAGEDIDIIATGSSVNIQSTESDAAAIVINASGAAGAIQLNSGTGGVVMDSGQTVNVTAVATAASPYAVLGSDYFITTDSTGGALQLDLPAAPATGRKIIVYDGAGQAAAGGNITISGNGKNIAFSGSSAATQVLNTAYESATLVYNGTLWLAQNVV